MTPGQRVYRARWDGQAVRVRSAEVERVEASTLILRSHLWGDITVMACVVSTSERAALEALAESHRVLLLWAQAAIESAEYEAGRAAAAIGEALSMLEALPPDLPAHGWDANGSETP